MSAATSQPLVGQSKSAAPFGVVALIAGALTLGAIGIALGQGIKATPAAEAVPADVQAALLTQRMGEKAQLFTARDPRLVIGTAEVQDRIAAGETTDARVIQHQGELRDRLVAAAFAAGHSGPKTAAQKGLLTPRGVATFPGKVADDAIGSPYVQRMLSQGAASRPYVMADGRIVDGHDSITTALPSFVPDSRLMPGGQTVHVAPTPYVAPDSRIYPGKVTDDAAGVVLDRWAIPADHGSSTEGKAWATGGRGYSIR